MAEKKPTKKCEDSTEVEIESIERKTFKQVRKTLQPSMELVINSLAVKLWSKKLIPEEAFEKIFDVAHSGAAWRSDYFMRSFNKKVKKAEKKDPSHKKAKQMIAKLVAVLREDRALHDVADIVANCEGHSDLQDAFDDITTSINSSLMQIAPSMIEIFTDLEYNFITDSSANHTQAATNAVLAAVDDAIRHNPSQLDTFKGILVDMGPPISELAMIIAETKSSLKPLKE